MAKELTRCYLIPSPLFPTRCRSFLSIHQQVSRAPAPVFRATLPTRGLPTFSLEVPPAFTGALNTSHRPAPPKWQPEESVYANILFARGHLVVRFGMSVAKGMARVCLRVAPLLSACGAAVVRVWHRCCPRVAPLLSTCGTAVVHVGPIFVHMRRPHASLLGVAAGADVIAGQAAAVLCSVACHFQQVGLWSPPLASVKMAVGASLEMS